VAAVGKSLYPGLIRDGYGARFSSGLVSSSGAIDILIPPSIAMILYGAAPNSRSRSCSSPESFQVC